METSTRIGFGLSWAIFLMMAAPTNACTCMPPKHPQEHFCHSDFVIRALVESRTENWTTYTAVYSVQVLDVLKEPENLTLFSWNQSDEMPNTTGNERVEPTTEIDAENYAHNINNDDILNDNLTNSGDETYGKTQRYARETPSDWDKERHAAMLHTGLWGAMCGVHLNLRSIYILGGRVVSDQLVIGLCGLHVLDDGKSLNKRQKAGFYRKYKDNCDCQIQYCTGDRCSPDTPDQCSVNSKLSFTDFMNCANRYSMCKRQNGKCQWTKNYKQVLCENEALRRRYLESNLKRCCLS